MRRAGEREDAGSSSPQSAGVAGDGEKVKARMDHEEPALTVLHEKMEGRRLEGQAVVREDRQDGAELAGGDVRWV